MCAEAEVCFTRSAALTAVIDGDGTHREKLARSGIDGFDTRADEFGVLLVSFKNGWRSSRH